MKRKRVSLKIRRSKVRKWRGGRGLVYGSLALIGLVILALLFPVVDGSSSALGEDITMTAGLTTKTTAYLYSTLSLSTSGQVDIDIVPKSRGALSIGAADVQVATNNTTGYSIFLSTVDQTNRLNQVDSALQYSGSEQQNYIAALGTTTTAGDYLATSSNLNTWGYALTTGEATSSTEYRGISSSSGDQIYTTTGTTSHDNYKLNVAVAVDTSLPAGGYRNGLVVTAVANPIILSGFNQIYYMQDMTPSICESAEMESTAQLVDKRDNKLYWVAKLKDGNCWMTQNLALDLDVNEAGNAVAVSENGDQVELNSGNTDINTDYWNESTGVKPVKTATVAPPVVTDITSVNSWSAGKVIWLNPLNPSLCGDDVDLIKTGEDLTSLAELCPQGYMDVTGLTGGYQSAENNSYNSTDKTYDEHYLIGNYYSFGASTAGTGAEVTNGDDATSSICAKNWKLPTSNEQVTMLEQYEVGNTEAGRIAARIKPVYSVITGFIDNSVGALRAPGYRGSLWSSTTNGSGRDLVFYFGIGDLILNAVFPKPSGYNIRCLVK